MKPAGRRQKGTRVEREIKELIEHAGIPTRRVIGSGAHGGYDERLIGDLQIGLRPDGTCDFIGECKARRKHNTVQLDNWLTGNDFLFLRDDGNKEPKVYMRCATYMRLLSAYWKVNGHHPADCNNVLGDEK